MSEDGIAFVPLFSKNPNILVMVIAHCNEVSWSCNIFLLGLVSLFPLALHGEIDNHHNGSQLKHLHMLSSCFAYSTNIFTRNSVGKVLKLLNQNYTDKV